MIRGSPGLAKSPLIVASVLIVTSRFVCDWRNVRHFPNEPFFPSCFDRLLLCLAMVSWFVLPWTLCSGWPSPNFELPVGLAGLAIYIIFYNVYPHLLIFYINTSMSSMKWIPQWNHRLYRPGVRSTSQVPREIGRNPQHQLRTVVNIALFIGLKNHPRRRTSQPSTVTLKISQKYVEIAKHLATDLMVLNMFDRSLEPSWA